MSHSHKFTDVLTAIGYCLAGNARVTFVSLKTGTRFTFRIRKGKGNAPWFVSLLSGPNNEGDYRYLGTIFPAKQPGGMPEFSFTSKSHISREAPSAKAFVWVWQELTRGNLPTTVECWHEGRCGRCSRALTDPQSISMGLGPECASKAA